MYTMSILKALKKDANHQINAVKHKSLRIGGTHRIPEN